MPGSSASDYAQTPGPGVMLVIDAGKGASPAIRENATACVDTGQQRLSHSHALPLGETRRGERMVRKYRHVREKLGERCKQCGEALSNLSQSLRVGE